MKNKLKNWIFKKLILPLFKNEVNKWIDVVNEWDWLSRSAKENYTITRAGKLNGARKGLKEYISTVIELNNEYRIRIIMGDTPYGSPTGMNNKDKEVIYQIIERKDKEGWEVVEQKETDIKKYLKINEN